MTGQAGSFAVAHNGNIVNAEIVRSWLEKRGSLFHSTSDSELFAQLIGMNGLGGEAGIRAAAASGQAHRLRHHDGRQTLWWGTGQRPATN